MTLKSLKSFLIPFCNANDIDDDDNDNDDDDMMMMMMINKNSKFENTFTLTEVNRSIFSKMGFWMHRRA